jgi:hypothetical protein
VATDSLELLDRQYARLAAQDGAGFIQELRRFYDFLTAGPAPVSDAVRVLRDEACEVEEAFNRHDDELVPQLVEIRNELVNQAPDADDSNLQRPQGTRDLATAHWTYSLANFDLVASDGSDRLIVNQGYDASRSGMLLRILESRLRELQWTTDARGTNPTVSQVNLRPELDGVAREVRVLAGRHRHAAQAYSAAVDSHGGNQMVALDFAVEQMNPAPREVRTDADEEAWLNETFKRVMGGWHTVEAAAAGRSLDGRELQTLGYVIERLKPACELVYEDVRMKLATTSPPQPAADYGDRLQAWMVSPTYQMLGWPCIGGAIQQAATGKSDGLALFIAAAVLGLVVPPAVRPVAISRLTLTSVAFIVVTSAAVVLALVFSGIPLAVGLLVILMLAYLAGRHSTASQDTL